MGGVQCADFLSPQFIHNVSVIGPFSEKFVSKRHYSLLVAATDYLREQGRGEGPVIACNGRRMMKLKQIVELQLLDAAWWRGFATAPCIFKTAR